MSALKPNKYTAVNCAPVQQKKPVRCKAETMQTTDIIKADKLEINFKFFIVVYFKAFLNSFLIKFNAYIKSL